MGLKDLLIKYKNSEKLKNILLVELDKTDVQRSELVKDVMKIYEKQDTVIKTNSIPFTISNSPIKNPNTRKLIMEITNNGSNDAALMPRKDLLK